MFVSTEAQLDDQTRRVAHDAGFAFVRELGEALEHGPVELPSYPDVTLRLQEALADDSVGTDLVVRIVGSEPMLAARVISVANSAALNPSSARVTDLRAAVARMGFDLLRSAAMSFAMAQLRRRQEFRAIEPQLNELWLASTAMAANCVVVARHTGRVGPDKALFSGLVSRVGNIYILTRANSHPQLFGDPQAYNAIQEQWHSAIARALLESWHVADEIVEAVGSFEERHADTRHGSTLADVMSAADSLHRYGTAPEHLQEVLPTHKAMARLGLGMNECILLMQKAADELATLRQAVGH